MNYTINEIPDEAVELSGTEMIPIWQGETKKVSVATLASSGIPVGAVMPFANGTTSEDWLLCDGRDTTGTADELQTHYPALYTYLGNSNVLPAQFDHSKLSDWEAITIPTTVATAMTMMYDGYITCGAGRDTSIFMYVDGHEEAISSCRTRDYSEPSINGFPFKKGQSIYVRVENGSLDTARSRVAYYKQPLYIKAT